MARRTIQVRTDDLDGGEAEETVKFALDGVQYEIDLSAGNAAKIRDILAPYVGAGRKIGRGGWSRVAGRRRGCVGEPPPTATRTALSGSGPAKGIKVSDRGRIKQEIVDRYHAEAGR